MPLAADLSFMRLAIEASEEALGEGNVPFGASLARDGELVHVSRNCQITRADVMGHAEVALVREVVEQKGRDALRGATVYASGEPCAMCTGAMFWAGITRVVYGATQADIIEVLGGAKLPIRSEAVLLGATPAVVVDGPLLREEALAVLRRFPGF